VILARGYCDEAARVRWAIAGASGIAELTEM